MKDDRLRLRVFEANGEHHIMLVHHDGEDLGEWSGPYQSEQAANDAAKEYAKAEGMVFP